MEHLNLPKGKPVYLFWVDSNYMKGWVYQEPEPVIKIQSIGYVVSSTNDAITITTSFDLDEEGCMSPLTIPWVSVMECREIKLADNLPKQLELKLLD